VGYRSRQVTYQFGTQKEIARDWFLGGSVSYESRNTTSDQGSVDMSTEGFNAGVVLKHQLGQWLLAAALKGGYDRSDVVRDIVLPGGHFQAHSSPESFYLGGRLRAAYEIPMEGWYLKPFADMDFNYANQAAYREKGAGLLDLAVSHGSQLSTMITPGIEIGGRADVGGTTFRPYLIAGVSFLDSGNWASELRLAEMPRSIAPFTVSTDMPTVYGNLTAGVEILSDKRYEVKAEYGLRGAGNYLSHNATLRLAMHF
jgi:outer membrane autotransporter protein